MPSNDNFRDEPRDPLEPAKGIANGCLLGAIAWLIIILLVIYGCRHYG